MDPRLRGDDGGGCGDAVLSSVLLVRKGGHTIVFRHPVSLSVIPAKAGIHAWPLAAAAVKARKRLVEFVGSVRHAAPTSFIVIPAKAGIHASPLAAAPSPGKRGL